MGYCPNNLIIPDAIKFAHNYHVHPYEDWIMCPACHRPISVCAHSCTHCGRVVPRYKHLDTLKWDNPNEYEVFPIPSEDPFALDQRLLEINEGEGWNTALMRLYSKLETVSVEELRREVGLIDGNAS